MPGAYNGLLVIDKPSGMTSRDVVNRALGWFPRGTRVGHAGTLDPLATGVLVLCVGAATRLIEYVQRMPKEYRAGIVLGATSDTDDADGTITPVSDVVIPTRAQIDEALATFVGTFEQVPPAYSAAKVTGRRAYDLARKGKDFDLEPRPVTIHGIDVVNFTYPHLEIVVRCGKGTYIRSLARDLGQRLGSGGYIASLRRLEIGRFTAAEAIVLDTTPAEACRRLLPMARAVDELPRLTLGDADAVRLAHGQHLVSPVEPIAPETAVFDEGGRLIAIAEIVDEVLHAKKVFRNGPEA